jgi:ABC-2 type transport system permease protein
MRAQNQNKKTNYKNILQIAQKEFADLVSSPLFLMFTVTYTLIVLVFSLRSVYLYEIMGNLTLMSGLRGIVQQIGWFVPLIGIALGFDTMIKERKSGSFNVLFTHPVFRDNIIAGKIAGIIGTLFIVIVFSTLVPVGIILVYTGTVINTLEFTRILIFTGLTFLYALAFAEIAMLISIIAKESEDSLVYNILIWLLICIVSGSIIVSVTSAVTGQSDISGLAYDLISATPLHHYSEVALGKTDLSWGGISNNPTIYGIFDTGFTLDQWFHEFWLNVLYLALAPIVLLILCFIVFLRKDMTI